MDRLRACSRNSSVELLTRAFGHQVARKDNVDRLRACSRNSSVELLTHTLDNYTQIKIEALGHRKKLLNRLSRRAPLDSFIFFYHGLKLMAALLGI